MKRIYKNDETKDILNKIIIECLYDLPLAAETLTIREEWNSVLQTKEKVIPHDGEGIKRIKAAISDIFHMEPEKDFSVYTKEETFDRVLYIEFKLFMESIIYETEIF